MSLLPLLKTLVAKDPFVVDADFSDKGIQYLDANTVQILSRFTELRSINLADNQLDCLPEDLSALGKIQDLNLSGNPFENLNQVVESLATMASLESLKVNLTHEDEVDFLLRTLVGLKTLNNLPVDRDDVLAVTTDENNSEQNNQNGTLGYDNTHQINPPTNRSDIQNYEVASKNNSTTIQAHNESIKINQDRPIEIKNQSPYIQKQLEKSQSVDQTKPLPNQVLRQVTNNNTNSASMHSVEFLDALDRTTESQIIKTEVESDSEKKSSKIPMFYPEQAPATVFNTVENDTTIQGRDASSVKDSTQSYNFMTANKQRLNTITTSNDPQQQQQYNNDFSQFFTETCTQVEQKGLQAEKIRQQLGLVKTADTVKGMQQMFLETLKSIPQDQAQILCFIFAQASGMVGNLNQKLTQMQKRDGVRENDMKLLQNELQEVIEAAEAFEEEANQQERKNEELRQENEQIKNQLQEQQEQQQQTDDHQAMYQGQQQQQQQQMIMANHGSEPTSDLQSPQFDLETPPTQDQYTQNQQQRTFENKKLKALVSGAQFSNSNSKILPLNKLKQTISDLYQSKQKFDQKARDTCQPTETMEQHLYTYLVQKFGLKKVIVEQATTIISSIRFYNSLKPDSPLDIDTDVLLFAKILKNEIDEGFHYVQQHITQTIKNYVLQILRVKYPLKSEAEVGRILKDLLGGKQKCDEFIWKKLIAKLYPQGNQELLAKKQDIIQQRKEVLQQDLLAQQQVRRLTADQESIFFKTIKNESRLMLQEVINGILEYQMQVHEKYLAKFNQLFQRVAQNPNNMHQQQQQLQQVQQQLPDSHDNNVPQPGVINENQFRNLMALMNQVTPLFLDLDSDAERLLEIIDPNNNQHITYTEVIQLLSAEPMTMPMSMGMSGENGSMMQAKRQPAILEHFGMVTSGEADICLTEEDEYLTQ